MRINKSKLVLGLKEVLILASISVFVVIVNYSVISLDMMYAEQPLMYAANQSIHSLGDLLHVYLYPRFLHIFSIPFFRPSGHFLIYQFLVPLLGWHSTKAFIGVNLLFLGFTGYVMIKLYKRLFPGYSMGGYLAFSLYLMHPALILSRLIVLHFEFAYVFFTVLSLYCFVRFCEKTQARKSLTPFICALIFYLVAISFKEPAVMLGPVLACYFCIYHYDSKAPRAFMAKMLRNKQNLEILAIVTVISIASVIYLTMPWLGFTHPFNEVMTVQEKAAATQEFFKILLGLSGHFNFQQALYQPQLIWREIVFPSLTCFLLWGFYALLIVACAFISWHRKKVFLMKSLLFLFLASLFFLILPISWAMALPWHLSLTLLFLSLMMGFSAEYLLQLASNSLKKIKLILFIMATVIGFSTMVVNKANINKILSQEKYALTVARNAVLSPPDLKGKLDDQSVIVVEDSILHNSYALGSSGYTFFSLGHFNYDAFQGIQNLSFLKYQPLYNGNLFKWAYLRPSLQEEIYPFQVNHMQKVPNEILYNWIKHEDNIFCLGYDKQGKWHDRSAAFKRNLKKEKTARLLQVHQYELRAAITLNGRIIYTKKLIFPDYQLCQYECDQNVQCKGFSYENSNFQNHSTMKCQFYDAIARNSPKFCATCIGFIKH